MALKPLRNIRHETIAFYCNEVAERGRVMIADTSVSGLGGMDEANALCKMPTGGIGAPLGVLMNDVVDVDLSRYRLNEHQDEVQKNSKVCLAKQGMLVTNCIAIAGGNPVAGSGAYFTTSGNFTMTQPANGTHSLVGRFDSGIDTDGYARVEINIP
jgi:hypothetical protein